MLKTFSNTLYELYESADSTELSTFPAAAIRLVGKLVSFDGAVLGTGESSAPGPDKLVIHKAFVHGRDPEILADYAKVAMVDPMTNKFAGGLSEPLASSFSDIEPGEPFDELRAFYKRHRLQHLLLFGDPGGDENPARWLVLYRSAGEAFNAQASQLMASLWPHLVRCLSINRLLFLQRQFPQHQHIGVALVSPIGRIDAAEPLFKKLCALEWPASTGKKIPDVVCRSWRRGLDYVGTRVKFKLQLQCDGFIVGQASLVGPLDHLTPAERIVANRFAGGSSAKVIANELGISVHTVRSQLAHVYEKLNIHDKAELANYLIADSTF